MAGRGFIFTIITSLAVAVFFTLAFLYGALQGQRPPLEAGQPRIFELPAQETYVPYQDHMRLLSLHYYRNSTAYSFIESHWKTKAADTNASLGAYRSLLAIYSNYTQSNTSLDSEELTSSGNATLGSQNIRYASSFGAKAVTATSSSPFSSVELQYSTTYGVSSVSYSTKPNSIGTIPFRLRGTSYDSATDAQLNCSASCSLTAGITYSITVTYNLPNITINITANSTYLLTDYAGYLVDAGHNASQNITLGTGTAYDLIFRGKQYSGTTASTTNPGFAEPSYPQGAAATKHYGNITAVNVTYNAIAIDYNNDTVYDSLYLDADANFTDGSALSLLQNSSYAFLNNRVFLILVAQDGSSIILEDVPGYYTSRARQGFARGW